MPKIAYYSGVSQSVLTDVLADLESVGLIRREARERKLDTTITHLFGNPVQNDEDWTKREPISLSELMTDERESGSTDPEPEAEEIKLSDDGKKLILQAILAAFCNPACLATPKEQETLTRRFPAMVKLVRPLSIGKCGSPVVRLYSLFKCIHADNSPRGVSTKRNVRDVKAGAAGAYIVSALTNWFTDYESAVDTFIAALPEDDNAKAQPPLSAAS